MSKIMPKTVSSKDIQTSYKDIFEEVLTLHEPVIVLKNNKPQVAIVSMDYLENLHEKVRQAEMLDALDTIRSYKEAKKNNQLIELDSLEDLLDDTKY